MPGASSFPEGTQPLVFDSRQRLLVKICDAVIAGGGGGGTGTFEGAGSPEGVQVGSPGNTYWDSTNSVFYVKNSGSGTNTGWATLVA